MSRSGYTLVEILISVTLSLFLLLGVMELFRFVGSSISDTQATLNMTRNLNWVAMTLRSDLSNLTEDPNKPSKLNGISPPGDNGYFEIIEGQNVTYTTGAAATQTLSTTHVASTAVFRNADGDYDNTIGDVDDILMFTTRAPAEAPFRGLFNGTSSESLTAEVIWFLRGNTLYRRQLLVLDNNAPQYTNTTAGGFYRENDVSVRVRRDQGGDAVLFGTAPVVVANTLRDLSRRENRYGHGAEYDSAWSTGTFSTATGNQHYNPFPHPIYYASEVNRTDDTRPWYHLRMPTMEECVSFATNGTISTTWAAGMPLMRTLHPLTSTQAFYTGPTAINPYPLAAITNTNNSFVYRDNPLNYSAPYGDLWENPNGWSVQDATSGSVVTLASNPRQDRAGEDIVMTNVISFDVKVWNPYWIPLQGATSSSTANWAPPQYVDLGQDQMLDPTTNTMLPVNYWYVWTNTPSYPAGLTVGPPGDRFGFCSKGKYADGTETVVTNVTANPGGLASTIAGRSSWLSTPSNQHRPPMPSVYDTWTREYETKPYSALEKDSNGIIICNRVGTGVDGEANHIPNPSPPPASIAPLAGTIPDQWDEWECPPPYVTPLKGIEITIRCFDPRGKNIKQIRIVKDFQ